MTLYELTIIYYFKEGLKPFIKVEMEQQEQEVDSFEEMVQKPVNVELKAGLRSTPLSETWISIISKVIAFLTLPP